MDTEHGSKIWFFPDGDIPPAGEGKLRGHESLLILNPNKADALITITVYFTDEEAKVLNAGMVKKERVRCIRTNEAIDNYTIPFGQYAMKVEASESVICQIGRMDVQQPNLAYYTVMGYTG